MGEQTRKKNKNNKCAFQNNNKNYKPKNKQNQLTNKL